MTKATLPPCPVCKTAKHVKAQGCVGDIFRCGKCGGIFDNDPNEGSDVFSDPSRRMERAEAKKYPGRR